LTEEKQGVPAVLFDAYADAVERYDVNGWRASEERRTLGETIARTRVLYAQQVEAMGSYVLEGGRDRWIAFERVVYHFAGFAAVTVEAAQVALRESGVGFSESTDPAFAGLVEPHDT
jgi:hypothetical protein